MKFPTRLSCVLALASSLSAQQLVRGDIDGIQGTQLFQLECTQIRIVSPTLNLQALSDASRQQNIEYDMQVVQVQANPTVLEILSATPVPEMFQMGNLRIGRSETWELVGVPGSQYGVFLGFRTTTSYAPLGVWGTWLLGSNFAPLQNGTINALGRSQFQFTMPNAPTFIGMEITSQAIVVEPDGDLVITNPDCKEVRN